MNYAQVLAPVGRRGRVGKPERRAARRAQPGECRRHGVNRTARRLRDGWRPVTFTALDGRGARFGSPVTLFCKIEYARNGARQ